MAHSNSGFVASGPLGMVASPRPALGGRSASPSLGQAVAFTLPFVIDPCPIGMRDIFGRCPIVDKPLGHWGTATRPRYPEPGRLR